MDRDFKAMFAVLFLVAGLFTGTNVMVNNESESNWVMWTLLFFALAIFLFIWLKRDDQQATKSTSDRARDALGDAHKKLENTAQAVATAEKATGVDKVELEEARAQAQAMDESAVASTETAVQEPEAAKPNGETLIEDAKDGEPVASAVVGEQTAAKSDADASDDIKPSDDQDMKDDASAKSKEAPAEEEGVAKTDTTDSAEAIEKGEMTPEQPATSSGEPDDLTIVEGIGPYYRDLLIDQGIDTYAKLAALTEADIIEIVQNAGGRKRASMATWPEQAKLAAAGDFDGLEKLKESLTAGRRD